MIKYLLLLVIKFYQFFISPWLGQNCKFHPTCSDYAKQAVNIRGVIIGTFLSCVRIIKCNPFSNGGYDPVPECKKSDPL